ncbi:MAG TPA: hypothetical protein VH374_10290 [Polyangia bacterium]|jgi:hypothetical protein|nr:hypothetical protein [Polyangia bacterium]
MIRKAVPGGRTLLVCLALVALGCGPSNSGNDPGNGGGSGGAPGGGTGGATVGGGSGGSSSSSGSGGSTDNGSGGTTISGSGGSIATTGSGGASMGTGGAATNNDGGATDAPASSSPGCTGLQGATFCEDFDKQTAGQKPAGMYKVSGAMVIDSTKAYSGKNSAYIHLNNPKDDSVASQMTFSGAPLFPALASDIFARAMVYITAVPGCCSTSNGIHWDLSTAKAGGTEYTLGSMYGNFMPVYQPGDDSVDTKTKWPEAKWVCIQWEFSGSMNYLDVKVDGVRAAPGIPVTKWKPATWTSINMGWINFQQSTIPVDMWIDDLAFGSKEIPCPTGPSAAGP